MGVPLRPTPKLEKLGISWKTGRRTNSESRRAGRGSGLRGILREIPGARRRAARAAEGRKSKIETPKENGRPKGERKTGVKTRRLGSRGRPFRTLVARNGAGASGCTAEGTRARS